MQRSQRAIITVLIFVLIVFVIFLAFKDIILRAIFILVAFAALLRVLWEIGTVPDQKRAKVRSKVRRRVRPLTVEYGMDGKVRSMVEDGPVTKAKKRRAVSVRVNGKGRDEKGP